MATEPIPELLQEFHTAVKNDRIEKASEVLDDIEAAYAAVQAAENAVVNRSLVARDKGDVTENQKATLHNHSKTAVATQLSRGGFLPTAATYLTLSDRTQSQKQKVLDTTQTLKDREIQFDTATERAKSISNEVNLPPEADIISTEVPDGPHPKGGSVKITIRIKNIGDKMAEGVKLTADGPSGITITPSEATIGAVDADTEAEVTFELSSDSSGDFTIEFNLSSNNAGTATDEIKIKFRNKGELVHRTKDSVQHLITRIKESNLSRGREQSLLSPLKTAESKMDDALRFIDNGDAEQANNLLEAAKRALGAFLNELNAKPSIDESLVVPLEKQAERTVEFLTVAEQAML